jgi:hypothetical protein
MEIPKGFWNVADVPTPSLSPASPDKLPAKVVTTAPGKVMCLTRLRPFSATRAKLLSGEMATSYGKKKDAAVPVPSASPKSAPAKVVTAAVLSTI